MDAALLTTAYLAPVSYYSKLYQYPHIEIETHCNYIKQTYRNRCNIVGANGIMPLSVPIIKPKEDKCPTRDIQISDHGDWQHLHWMAILSAYGSTPFFEYYQDDLIPFYKKKTKYLFDLNEQLREVICSLLDIHPQVYYTESYRTELTGNEKDFREIIHPKKAIKTTDPEFKIESYYQVFGQKFGFIPDMSIIDLLFNMGPESVLILNR